MKDKVITIRMREDVAKLVNEVATQRGENLSGFIRRSVLRELTRLSYLSQDDKKALEIQS